MALFRWRTLPYCFAIVWLVLLAVPAVFARRASPLAARNRHAAGFHLLAVLAMLAVGQRLLSKWQILALWLPLPFLLFSGLTSLRDYFQAWKDLISFGWTFKPNTLTWRGSWPANAPADTSLALACLAQLSAGGREFYTWSSLPEIALAQSW